MLQVVTWLADTCNIHSARTGLDCKADSYLLETSQPNQTASLARMLSLVRSIKTSIGWLL